MTNKREVHVPVSHMSPARALSHAGGDSGHRSNVKYDLSSNILLLCPREKLTTLKMNWFYMILFDN